MPDDIDSIVCGQNGLLLEREIWYYFGDKISLEGPFNWD